MDSLTDKLQFTKGFGNVSSTYNNDCAVRAISLAFNTEYDYVFYLLKDLGRTDGRGTYRHHSIKVINDIAKLLNIKVTEFNLQALHINITVEEFLKTYSTGRYICYVDRHVFTVIDGKAHDTFLRNKYVRFGIKLDGDFTHKIQFKQETPKDALIESKPIEFHFD